MPRGEDTHVAGDADPWQRDEEVLDAARAAIRQASEGYGSAWSDFRAALDDRRWLDAKAAAVRQQRHYAALREAMRCWFVALGIAPEEIEEAWLPPALPARHLDG